MPSEYHTTKKETYRQQRAVSHGASITLVSKTGQYVALCDCAKRCAVTLGKSGYSSLDGIDRYEIPFAEMHVATQKLKERYSVALVDVDLDGKDGTRFVCLATIPANKEAVATPMPSTAGEPVYKEDKQLTADDF